MWIFGRKGSSGFSACSTAEEVAQGIDGSGLTAIVTGPIFFLFLFLRKSWLKIFYFDHFLMGFFTMLQNSFFGDEFSWTVVSVLTFNHIL